MQNSVINKLRVLKVAVSRYPKSNSLLRVLCLFGGLLIVLSQSASGSIAKSSSLISLADVRSTSRQKANQDVGRRVTFSTLDRFAGKCVMIYGSSSFGGDDFLIQDCGGASWENRWKFHTGFVKRMSFFDENRGWLVAGHGLVRVDRSDGVFKPLVVRNNPDENIEDVFFLNEMYGWICGANGLILSTEDGGITWKSQESHVDVQLNQVRFIDQFHGWASGAQFKDGKRQEVLLLTKDRGVHWIPSAIDAEQSLFPVSFTSPSHGCAINERNDIVCTDNGEDWTVAYSDKGQKKHAIFFLDERHGWVAGDGIWHTADGGKSWHRQFSLPRSTLLNFEQLVFVDERLGWARTLDAVWRTNDGGTTWIKISESWTRQLNDD